MTDAVDLVPVVQSKVASSELRAERYAYLITAATKVLLQRGFNQISVRELATAIGWQVGTLYTYIATKQDLLYLISNYLSDNVEAAVLSIDQNGPPTETFIAAATRYFEESMRLNRKVRLVNREYASLLPEHAAAADKRALAIREVFANIVRRGVATGEFCPVIPDLFANDVIVLAQSWALKRWAFPDISREDFFNQQLDLLCSQLLLDRNRPADGLGNAPREGNGVVDRVPTQAGVVPTPNSSEPSQRIARTGAQASRVSRASEADERPAGATNGS